MISISTSSILNLYRKLTLLHISAEMNYALFGTGLTRSGRIYRKRRHFIAFFKLCRTNQGNY